MGEQNRRAIEGEGRPNDKARPLVAPHAHRPPPPDDGDLRALGPEADERQTALQAPDGANPGEGSGDASVG